MPRYVFHIERDSQIVAEEEITKRTLEEAEAELEKKLTYAGKTYLLYDVINDLRDIYAKDEEISYEQAVFSATQDLQYLARAIDRVHIARAVHLVSEHCKMWQISKELYVGPTQKLNTGFEGYNECYNKCGLLHEYLFSSPTRADFLKHFHWLEKRYVRKGDDVIQPFPGEDNQIALYVFYHFGKAWKYKNK